MTNLILLYAQNSRNQFYKKIIKDKIVLKVNTYFETNLNDKVHIYFEKRKLIFFFGKKWKKKKIPILPKIKKKVLFSKLAFHLQTII